LWCLISAPWEWRTDWARSSRLRRSCRVRILRLFPDVGEGAEKARIVALARERGLDNLRLSISSLAKKFPPTFALRTPASCCSRKTTCLRRSFPPKMLEFMSCARPVILGVDGQARAILEDARGGLVIGRRIPLRWSTPSAILPRIRNWPAISGGAAGNTLSASFLVVNRGEIYSRPRKPVAPAGRSKNPSSQRK